MSGCNYIGKPAPDTFLDFSMEHDNFGEGRPVVFQSGAFVNGFYESWPIVYDEEAYGFAKTGQSGGQSAHMEPFKKGASLD